MCHIKLLILINILELIFCDWVSDWMVPVKDEIKQFNPSKRSNTFDIGLNTYEHMVEVTQNTTDAVDTNIKKELTYRTNDDGEVGTVSLKIKLDNTLRNAKALAETLKQQIFAVSIKENLLKDAIANGRSGITTVTVSTMGRLPRTYMIRDGHWTMCNGVVQFPISQENPTTNLFQDLFSVPRCIGQEMSTKPDPCVFNSVIKYETIPTRRTLEYVEDSYLCLKLKFNSTLEQYMSVPKQLINETCRDGHIRDLIENHLECGVRVMSEYTYYPPRRSTVNMLPLEYCVEKDGACKMIIAWHISNSTIENFEFLKNEQKFKKYFIKSDTSIERVI